MIFLRERLKPRLYQEKIFNTCVKSNCLVVLPTGLGKTIIALMLAMHALNRDKTSNVVFLAPTKPLIEQHKRTFDEFIHDEGGEIIVLSGETPPDERMKFYANARIIFATPQTIENDLLTRKLTLAKTSLVVFDECHRGVGDYAYTFINKVYNKQRDANRKILGLSASPGSDKAKIIEVCKNLGLNEIVHMDESDIDVKPYVNEKEINKVELVLPKELENVKNSLEVSLKKRLIIMKNKNLLKTSDSSKISKRVFLGIQRELQLKLKDEKSAELFENISLVSEVIKILYALELLQTQGVKPLISYFEKMKKQYNIKSNRTLLSDEDFREAMVQTFNVEDKVEHPKFNALKEIVLNNEPKKNKFIIFTNYRDTGKRVVNYLADIKGLNPVLFIGQAGKEGLSQKEQVNIIKDFDAGFYNILVATSVAEEGLHIPSVDYAIFFEPVPSGLRMIQRRGRVGRTKIGKVIVMYTKGCIDEKYLYISKAKEKRMKEAILEVKDALNDLKQSTLEAFSKNDNR
ncbi:ATP-dependent RNA helicase RhlB [Candidatus Tiddalikarchaeum anstoanum]|nr:ATP-dependent RNA helicase RhlB [Candidatus Tiddalikarchaeum anstoanum]